MKTMNTVILILATIAAIAVPFPGIPEPVPKALTGLETAITNTLPITNFVFTNFVYSNAGLFRTNIVSKRTNEKVEVIMNIPTNSWYWPAYFADIVVYEAGTRRPFTIEEIHELLDKLPNVKYVNLNLTEPIHPRYSIEHLAYPQYEEYFKLTKTEWADLQRTAKEKLIANKGAADEVIRHWVEIVGGKVPFGLKVAQ